MTKQRHEMVVGKAEGPVVLDLGAVQHDSSKADNDDWLHDHLVANFETVIGVDILHVDVCELNKQGYNFRQADVTEMELPIEADTVVCGELIEHIANPGLMLERIYEHLKPDGKLIITTPNPWALVNLKRLVLRRLSINQEHVAWYGPTVIAQLLERYGFRMERAETTRRNHSGLMRLAQSLDSDYFGGTTWVITATKA